MCLTTLATEVILAQYQKPTLVKTKYQGMIELLKSKNIKKKCGFSSKQRVIQNRLLNTTIK